MGQKISIRSDTNNNQNLVRSMRKPCNDEDELVDRFRPTQYDQLADNPMTDANALRKYAWNPEDSSRNIYILPDDPLTFHRHPIARSTDSIRGKIGFDRGFHVWEIRWNCNQRGTHAVIGVSTSKAPLNVDDYTILVGSNQESWGWDVTRQKLFHDNKEIGSWYPMYAKYDYEVSERVTVILDMDEGTLAFADNDRYLGVAFRGLKGKTLFPSVSTVWGHVEITMKYIGGLRATPMSLKNIARNTIRKRIGEKHLFNNVKTLVLPNSLKMYLLYQ